MEELRDVIQRRRHNQYHGMTDEIEPGFTIFHILPTTQYSFWLARSGESTISLKAVSRQIRSQPTPAR
jgi:hypothetical protein